MCECKQAKQQECLPRECLVQDKKHTEKKALLTAYILDPTFTISKTFQQRKAIPNSVDKGIKSNEHVKATQG